MDRNEFADLVGKSGQEAQQMLFARGFNQTTAPIVTQDMMVTMDYRTDRVRIYVDENGIVATAPQRG